jgi:hypothetical protein
MKPTRFILSEDVLSELMAGRDVEWVIEDGRLKMEDGRSLYPPS